MKVFEWYIDPNDIENKNVFEDLYLINNIYIYIYIDTSDIYINIYWSDIGSYVVNGSCPLGDW